MSTPTIRTLADFKRAVMLPGATLERLAENGYSHAAPRKIVRANTVEIEMEDGLRLPFPPASQFAVVGSVLHLRQLRMLLAVPEVVAEPVATPTPADPEDQNDDRAAAAERAVLSFAQHYGETDGNHDMSGDLLAQNISDLLANIAHLCDRNSLTMASLLRAAMLHYEEETLSVDPEDGPQGTQFDGVTIH